ncbi:MAG: Holliday junction resolvase RuvX [Gammaproteobacteria bacterium]|nr:Holliday junction resolvase RuvX [Gammaproteobacteria bacterium]MDE2250526.1 Holliday junction resolvase RuvX [Gammaproteobacteria bacterium]
MSTRGTQGRADTASVPTGFRGTAIAFDFGLRRIGLAAGDTITRTAAPLAAVGHGEHGPDWAAIGRALAAYRPGLLVVGYPYNEDGTPGKMAGPASAFAAALAARSGLGVERVDERYSSLEAAAELRQRRAAGTQRRRVRHADVDSLAAAIILERWLRGESFKR